MRTGLRIAKLAGFLGAAALLLAALVSGYGAVRLARANAALSETVGPAEVAAVRDVLVPSQPVVALERPALRLARAIEPFASRPGEIPSDELRTRCRRALEASTRVAADFGEEAPHPPWSSIAAEARGLVMVAPASHWLAQCGLTLEADGGVSPEIGLPAIELLGTVARDLERGPSLLALAVGLRAEKHQLTLIERLHERPLAPGDRARLRNALPTDDLATASRRVLIAEAVLASNALALPVEGDGLLARGMLLLLGPLTAAAQVNEITHILRGDQASPRWPDTWFVGRGGLRQTWHRLLAAPTEVAVKRERVRQLLTL